LRRTHINPKFPAKLLGAGQYHLATAVPSAINLAPSLNLPID